MYLRHVGLVGAKRQSNLCPASLALLVKILPLTELILRLWDRSKMAKKTTIFSIISKTTVRIFRIESPGQNIALMRCYNYINTIKTLQAYAWQLLTWLQNEGGIYCYNVSLFPWPRLSFTPKIEEIRTTVHWGQNV